MFDIGWMELMIVGMVMLLVVGPKELPGLLRTIGKYAGVVKRQANEFRAQFDEAIKDSEFSELKKDMESLGEETESSMREASNALDEDLAQFDEHSTLDDDDYKDDEWVSGVVEPEDKPEDGDGDGDGSGDEAGTDLDGDGASADVAAAPIQSDAEAGELNEPAEPQLEPATPVNGSAAANGHDRSDSLSKSGESTVRKAPTDERKSDA